MTAEEKAAPDARRDRSGRSRYARSLTGGLPTAAIFLSFLATGLHLIALEASRFFLYEDVSGYGDSSVLYGVRRLQHTGSLYYDVAQPPYTPVLYSPAVYFVYALPGRIVPWTNPFLGPRLMAMAAFLLCAGVAVSLVRATSSARSGWVWALLLVGSLTCLRGWVFLLRGDFWGILFSLLAMRLIFMRSQWAILLAGLSAGLATQFKITYVAAMAAGILWLLLDRRWKDAMLFLSAGASTSAGVYLLFWTHEPRMMSHITALGAGISDIPGCLGIIYRIVTEPLFVLAALAVLSGDALASRRGRLLLMYASISFAIASLTELQSGGNVNYFFEALFALIPAAVLGVVRLSAWTRRNPGMGLYLMVLVTALHLIPALRGLTATTRSAMTPAAIQTRNRDFLRVQNVLAGRHIFSTVPRVALFDPVPAFTDPYLFSQLVQLGKVDAQPLVNRVREAEFDLAVTSLSAQSWRGVPHIAPQLREAINASYRPVCVWSGFVVHLPRNRPEEDGLRTDLQQAGCVSAAPEINW